MFGYQPNTKVRHTGFRQDSRGNVAMMFAMTAPVLLFAAGVAIDFTNAAITRSRLNAAADAAALAAVSPNMIRLSDSAASAAALAMFTARAKTLSTLAAGQYISPNISITHPGSSLTRQVTVTYTEPVTAVFGTVLHMFGALASPQGTIGVSGNSTAEASAAANVDFYLLLDNSPSMSLPSTQNGISQMEGLTYAQGGGCAFACHQSSTNNGDTQGNPCSNGSALNSSGYCASVGANTNTQIDNYQLAKNNGISLKLNELTSGIGTLMQTAATDQQSTGEATPPIYRFAAYSMNSLWAVSQKTASTASENVANQGNYALMALTPNYTSSWATSSLGFGVMEMYANNVTCGDPTCLTAGSTGDVATNYDIAMSSINTTMPNPGAGTNVSGDTPQEVLFFITDGVEDETLNNNRLIQAINANGATNYCDAIKARGIKIAILYTEYLPVPSNWFYEDNVAPFQPNIAATLQSCASPGLFYDAALGADLGAALVSLFNTVLQQNASLTQ